MSHIYLYIILHIYVDFRTRCVIITLVGEVGRKVGGGEGGEREGGGVVTNDTWKFKKSIEFRSL